MTVCARTTTVDDLGVSKSEKDRMDDSVEVPLGQDYDPCDPKSEASDPKHGDKETAEGLDLTEEGGEVLFQVSWIGSPFGVGNSTLSCFLAFAYKIGFAMSALRSMPLLLRLTV